MILITSLALFACTPTGDGGNGGSGGDETPTYTREQILEKLSSSLDASVARLDAARVGGTVTTSSKYSIIVEDLKYTLTYNAAVDYSHVENSRIYFKIYDDESTMTRLMAYYDAGTLYYENNGSRKKISGFGTSGLYSLFLGLVGNVDMSYSLDTIASAVSGTALENLIRSDNLKLYGAGENRNNISIRNIELDTLKTVPNNAIADFFGSFGTAFDAIGTELLGASFSDLGRLRIRSLDANTVEFYSENDVFDQMYFDFSGYMETLSPFSLTGGFKTVPGFNDVEVDALDDEVRFEAACEAIAEKNGFSPEQKADYIEKHRFHDFSLGKGSFAGTISFPSLNAAYDTTIDFSLNYGNNAENLIMMKVKDNGLDAAAVYYLDGKLYLDAGTLFDVFDAGLGLSYFNLPKAVAADFDLSDFLGRIIDVLDNLVRETDVDISEETRDEALKILVSKIQSDGSVIGITIDKELITALNAISPNPIDANNVAAYLASILGVNQTFIDNVLGASAFDSLTLKLYFDLSDGGFSSEIIFENETVVKLDLKPVAATDEIYEETENALVYARPFAGSVRLEVVIGDKTYYLDAENGTVADADGGAAVGSFFPTVKKFSVNGAVYSFAAPSVVSQATNEKVGVFAPVQKKLSVNGTAYRFDDGRVLSEIAVGSFDAPVLTVGGTRYFVRDGKIYADAQSSVVLGTVDGDVVSINSARYLIVNGDLFEIFGRVEDSGGSLSVVISGEVYLVGTSAVYRDRGLFRSDEGIISLDGVNYYVRDGKVYQNLDFAVEAGTVDESLSKITINGKDYYFDTERKEVSQHVFGEIAYPEELGFTVNGEIKVSGMRSQDISKLLGAFIGDSLGLNTPNVLDATDRLLFDIRARAGFDGEFAVYVKLVLRNKGGEEKVLIELATLSDDPETVLIDFKQLDIRFRSPSEEVLQAFRRFAGEGSIFAEDDIISALIAAMSEASVVYDKEGIRFSFDYRAVAGQEVVDPLLKLIGISNLSANGTLKIDYSPDMLGWRTLNDDEGSFVEPKLASFPTIVDGYESIYDAEWIEEISFVNPELDGLTLKIPYDPETVKIVTGKNIYYPRASLLGQVLTYTLMLKGGENATKVAVEVVGNAIVFDSYEKNPVPEKIAVRYDDGTEGEVKYRIIGFDEGLITEAGMTPAPYSVIIGEGKIAETVFNGVSVSVRSRELVKQNSQNPDGYGSYYHSTVVGSLSVDPYEYALSGEVTGLPETVNLRFFEQVLSDDGTYEKTVIFDEFCFEWDFDGKIDVSGGTFYAKAARMYKKDSDTEYTVPDLVYEIVVLPKIFSYVQFGNESGRGVHTVDVFDPSTYTVPARSREGYRLAVYFADGHYRIVGNAAMGLETDSMFDGYFDTTIEWKYPEATHFSLTGYPNPLGGETAIDTAVLAVGTLSAQQISARVSEPSRNVKEAGSVSGVVENVIDGGAIKRDVRSFRYDNVSFGGEEFVTVNPYRTAALPEFITLNIEDRTTGNVSPYTYPIVRWLTDGEVVKEQDGRYYLKYPATEETWFKAVAVVGEGRVTDEITVRIFNPDAEYAAVTFDGFDENVAETTADAYSPFRLPSSFGIRLFDGTELRYGNGEGERAFEWKVAYGTENERTAVMIGEEDYNAFRAFIEGRSRYFDENWLSAGYNFENRDYSVVFTAHVPSDVNGSLEQTVEFTVNVKSLTPLGIDENATDYLGSTRGTVVVNRYDAASAELLYALTDGGYSALPVKMYARQDNSEITYFFKVGWTSPSDFAALIDGMKAVDGGAEYALKGIIFGGVDNKEQEFDAGFRTLSNEVLDAGSFYFRSLSTALTDVLTSEYALDGNKKTLTVNLLKPYALKLLSNGNFVYALPSDYFAFTLQSIYTVFGEGGTGSYATDARAVIDAYSENGKTFDASVYDFGRGNSENSVTEFAIRVSEGSAEDYVFVKIIASPDVLISSKQNVEIEPYNDDGSLKITIEAGYAAGYPVTNEYSVVYNNSGEVVYTLDWTINNPVVNNGLGLVYNASEKTWYLPISSVSVNGGASTLSATLPDGSQVVRVVSVRPKNIGGTAYSAEPAFEGGYGAVNGAIVLRNMYQLFEIMKFDGSIRVIDVSKLPSVIVPRTTATFSGDTKFTVDWRTENYFSVSENGTISGISDGDGRYLVAHADISGYNGESQRVYLYVNVEETSGVASIRAEGYDFRINDDGFSLVIDPYKDNGRGGYDWTVALPEAATVELFGGSSYTFASGLVYSYGDERIFSVSIDYKNVLRLTGANDIPINAASAKVGLTLPDGYTVSVTIEVVPREIVGTDVPYLNKDGETEYRDGVYFIDPYNAATHGIPDTVRVNFADGDSLELKADWQIAGAADFEIAYGGGEFTFTATLGGEGAPLSEVQIITLAVTVLNRALKDGFTAAGDGMTAELRDGELIVNRHFADYIGARASDIFRHDFVPEDFACPELPAEAGNMPLSYPVLKIYTYYGAEAGDSAIVNAMENVEFAANLAAGEIIGQSAKVYITTDRLSLIHDFGDFAASDGDRLFFNPFTKDSLKTEFRLSFAAETFDKETGSWSAPETRNITFYTEKSSSDDPERSRHLIYWDASMADATSGLVGFTYGNAAKTVGTVANTVSYIYLNVGSVRLDLGYGRKESGAEPFDYVVDPLTPELLSSVTAEGQINGQWYPLGEVALLWDEANTLNSVSLTGEPRRQVAVNIHSGISGMSAIPITVNVYYLDRSVKKAFTSEQGYSASVENGLYKIFDASIANFGMSIDPVAKFENGQYVYPKEIVAEFAAQAAGASPSVLSAAVEKYGLRLNISDARWGLNGKPVTLAGTGSSHIDLSLVEGVVSRGNAEFANSFVETPDVSVNPFTFRLTVSDRSITATSITTASNIHLAFDGSDGSPDYSIDPYNITLPKSFIVSFGSGIETTTRQYSWQGDYSELWHFDAESWAKLQREEIINGSALPEDMFAIAYFTVNAETFEVKFPITARVVDVNDWGNKDVVQNGLISGGVIYVKAGMNTADIVAQLPTEIYYNFAPSADAAPSYSPVPLKFENVTFYKAGTYTLRAILGKVSRENNIAFTVEVIEPELLDVRTTTDAVGTVIDFSVSDMTFDTLPVSVNSSGNIVAGLETERMPEYVAVSDGVYVRISGVSYALDELKAYVTCAYEFATASDAPRIAGTQDGTRSRTFVFEVPLTVNRTDLLGGDTALSSQFMYAELGQPINLSAFPKAIADGREYTLFWDVETGGVNTDIAGEYAVTGYLLDAFNEVRTFRVAVIVLRRELAHSEFGIYGTTVDERVVVSYSGRRIDWDYKMPANCIDENGDRYAPVPEFTYSADGGQSWTSIQPVAVGVYLMKMTVDDTNVFGEKTVTLQINKAVINTDDIGFAATTTVYNGMPQQPEVIGLPKTVGYSFRMTRVENGSVIEHPEGAINAYSYTATLIIEESDSYVFTGSANRSTDFVITKANPAYRAAVSEVYNGLDRHIYVEGIPEVFTGGMTVTYTYRNVATGAVTTNRIRNAGVYIYSIEIHGGINYYDNTLGGEYTITQAPLTVDVGRIEVPYLDEMPPLDSELTVSGVVGDDASKVFGSVFGDLVLTSTVRLDGYSAPGSYPVYASGLANPNYRIIYLDDAGNDSGDYRYNIVLPEGTVDVGEKAAEDGATLSETLGKLIGNATNGDLKLYLPAGNYGNAVLDNVGVSLYLYGEFGEDGTPVSVLDSLVINGGTVNLYALSFAGLDKMTSVYLGGNAGSVLLDRVTFLAKKNASGANVVAEGSVGIYAEHDFRGSVSAYGVKVYSRFTGIYMAGGNLTVENSLFDGCVAGIETQGITTNIIDSTFARSTLYAVYIANPEAKISVNGNEFRYNAAAITYNFSLNLINNAEVVNENVYFKNNENLVAR